MGCFNCKEQKVSEDQNSDYVDERSRLLDHDGLKTPNQMIDGGYISSAHSMTKTDEQAILNKILHKTAQKIIDVAAIEPHSMERSEYMEKMKLYLDKTSRFNIKIPKTKNLSSVTHAPLNVLQADTISPADLKLIREASEAVNESLKQMCIVCVEPLNASLGEEPPAIAS